ncbi:hypothetical protein ACFQT0_05905 [Hymenobacter humi]|uniref:Uncharacterized protein n=1 Tax=Hymenobacter humi TaxID=1411620 RepID=A0ABW2U0Z1_9BACT
MDYPLPEAARRYVAAHLHDDPAHLALQARRHPGLPVPEPGAPDSGPPEGPHQAAGVGRQPRPDFPARTFR